MLKLTLDEFVQLCEERCANIYVCQTINEAIDHADIYDNMAIIGSAGTLLFWNSICALRFSGIKHVVIIENTDRHLKCEIVCKDANGKEHRGNLRVFL